MRRGLLPCSSVGSSTPVLADSSVCGAVHPVALDSGRLSSAAVSTLVHPVVIAGRSSGSIVAKASVVLDYVVGRVGNAATDGVTGY